MADTQRIRFNNGQKELVLTRAEFRDYVANLSDAAKARLTFPEGQTYDAVYQNTEGDLAREQISGEQLIRRGQMGQDALITGADDPKLQAHNRQQAQRAKRAVAEDEGIVAAFDAMNPASLIPGIAQGKEWMENAALGGPEEVARIRSELRQANQGETLFGTMGLGFGAGGAAMGTLRGLGIGAKTGKGLGLLAHVGVDEAAFETATYTKYVMDMRQDFQAEELAQNIVQGMLFAAPVVGGALARKPLWSLAKGAAGGVGRGFGHLQSGMVMAGLKTTDAAKASKMRRGAAIVGIGRRFFGGRKMVTKVDELAEMRKTMQAEELNIGRATPESLKRNKTKREVILDEVRKNMDQGAGYLDNIDVGGMAPALNAVRSGIRKAQNTIWSINRGMKVSAVRGVGKLNKQSLGNLEAAMDNFLGHADELGYHDMVGHLRDVGTHQNFGQLFQARLDLTLKARSGNHATQGLADALKNITEDAGIWGKGLAPEQARNLNDGIDALADGFEALKKLDIPDDLSRIPDGTDLNALDDAVAKIRSGKDSLHASKLLDTSGVRRIEDSLNKIEDALVDGKRAYVDAVKLNKARNSAAKNHKARFDKVKSGDVETVGALEARMADRVSQWSEARTGLVKAMDKLVESGVLPVYSNRLLKTLRESTLAEKEELFLQMHERIPMLVGNPEFMAKEMEPFLTESPTNPEVHTMAGVASGNALFFLHNKLGRIDRTLYGRGRTPRRDRVLRFAETYGAMANPMDVAYAAVAGEVTQDMVDAIRVANPVQYTELSVVLSDVIANADHMTLPRKTVKGINKFLGGADPIYSGAVIMQLQSNYAQNEQQQQAVGGPMPSGQQFNQSHPQDGDNAFTFTQRLQSY
jgi:hypothetical protein